MSSSRLKSQPQSPKTPSRNTNPISIVFPKGWCTYMLICIDGSYYVGLTNDLAQRIQDHSSGKGPTYTKLTKAKLLIWFESHPNREAAAAREKQLKGWTRKKKHALARAELHVGPAAQNVWLPLD
jgi:predicted GIY-YIG superfamily endonuclease